MSLFLLNDSRHYTVLAGGTGAAKFLRGLVQVVPENQVHVIVNVGDDTDLWGLRISPDIDTILYALSGRLDTERGWGLENETFRCLEQMEAYGLPAWFKLGDADLAMHIARTEFLRSGLTLTECVERMKKALGVQACVFPATDDLVRTRIETTDGVLGFQEFFVRERWQPDVRSVAYAGAAEARASANVLHSIREARLVIIAPSNPITSIGPITAIHGIRDALRCTRAEVVAISPIIGKAPVSGPAGKLMEACGYEVSPSGVARCYHEFLDNIVIDRSDEALAATIRYETIGVRIADILMKDDESARRLAEFVIGPIGRSHQVKTNENRPSSS
ncbi:MAG: 2-phospho-L-lactate transferase [Acidobacteria bacterium]|nr:2-phospho-L-lactate transferase [Acidobacteriota bacterium]